MVKERGMDISIDRVNQAEDECPAEASRIRPSTPYAYCSERLSPFGGLLGLVKFN